MQAKIVGTLKGLDISNLSTVLRCCVLQEVTDLLLCRTDLHGHETDTKDKVRCATTAYLGWGGVTGQKDA